MSISESAKIQLGGKLNIYAIPGEEKIRIEMGKEQINIPLSELWAATFTLCDSERQDKLMPVRKTEMMTYERVHRVQAKKDIRKGDFLKVKCQINVPLTVVESLGGLVDQKSGLTPSGIILPR